MKYIDADRLKELLDAKYKEFTKKAKKDCPLQYQYMTDGLEIAKQFIASLQQEQPETTSIKGYLNRDIGGQLIISLSPNYMDDEWMLLESKLFPNIKSGDVPRCVNITIKEI